MMHGVSLSAICVAVGYGELAVEGEMRRMIREGRA